MSATIVDLLVYSIQQTARMLNAYRILVYTIPGLWLRSLLMSVAKSTKSTKNLPFIHHFQSYQSCYRNEVNNRIQPLCAKSMYIKYST